MKLLTNYGRVIVLLDAHTHITVRALAEFLDITERGAQRIIHELEQNGHIRRWRDGKTNAYEVLMDRDLVTALRHVEDRQ